MGSLRRSRSRAGRGGAAKPADPDAPLLKLPKGDDFTFSPDGSRLWLAHTSVNASTVRGVEVPGGGPFAEFNALPNLRGVACSPDGKRVAASNHYGVVAVYDAVSGKEVWKSGKTNEETHSLAYAPDGSMVLNSGSETCVRRRDAKSGKELPPLELGEGWLAGDLAFSPDGKTLAVAAVKVPGAEHVSYWDWRAGKELVRHKDPGSITHLGFLPGGRGLVVAAYKVIYVRDVKSHALVKRLKLQDGLKGASVHPGGGLLACNTYAGAEIRALPSGKVLKKLETKELYPSHWAFSPDGRYVLLVASPKSLLWDLEGLIGRGL